MTGLEALPGGELFQRGLDDLAKGKQSIEALLVAVASHRLSQAGLDVPDHGIESTELRLYDALVNEHGQDAYGRYNSLLRRLDSFASALEREQGKAIRGAG